MARRSSIDPDRNYCCYGGCLHGPVAPPGQPRHPVPITAAELRGAVRISNGLMHADCHAAMTRRVAELLRPRPDAVPYTTLCEVCREWVESIYHVGPQDKKRFCILCAAKAGDSTAVASLTRQGRWDPTTHKPIDPPPPPPPPPPSPAAPTRATYAGTFNTLDDL